jgi:CRISPR/Cas system-associated exonuclease Cas4 (RecB family)
MTTTKRDIILERYDTLYNEVNAIHPLKNMTILPDKDEIETQLATYIMYISNNFSLKKDYNYVVFKTMLKYYGIKFEKKDVKHQVFDLIHEFVIWILTFE